MTGQPAQVHVLKLERQAVSPQQNQFSFKITSLTRQGKATGDPCVSHSHRYVGLVVKASTLGEEDTEFDSPLRRGDFSGSSHTSDIKRGTPVATLPGSWCYRVSAGTDWQYTVTG